MTATTAPVATAPATGATQRENGAAMLRRLNDDDVLTLRDYIAGLVRQTLAPAWALAQVDAEIAWRNR